jgi:ribosomal protein S18 acetylase RimI-like enzyme
MNIRKIHDEDHEAIVQLMESLPEWFMPIAVEHVRIDLRYHQGFVVLNEEEQILGFVTYFVYEAVGVIGWIGVKREYHNQGIGTHLLQAVERVLIEDGISMMQVYTLSDSVEYAPYEATRAFYYRNGFTDYRRIPTDNPGCPEELYLRKKIRDDEHEH